MADDNEGFTMFELPPQPTETVADEYLGDSVYVGQLEQWPQALVLTTRNGLPTDPSNTIVLEPEVLRALVAYAKKKMILDVRFT